MINTLLIIGYVFLIWLSIILTFIVTISLGIFITIICRNSYLYFKNKCEKTNTDNNNQIIETNNVIPIIKVIEIVEIV